MNSKKFMIISIAILVIAIVGSGGTYAWIKYNSTSNGTDAKVNLGVCTPIINFDGGSSIEGDNLKPILDISDAYNNGVVKAISISVNKTCDRTVTGNINLKIDKLDAGLKDSTFVYVLRDTTTQNNTSVITSGNFENVNEGDIISLLSNVNITTTKKYYTLYIYLDGNQVNKSTTQGQSFKFSLYGSGDNAVRVEAATYINNLYNSSTKTTVTNNNIEYQYDTTHNLMKDIGDNIRYYGATPNNYIYFNCTDYSNQSADTCEVWRIIGTFASNVKIIRNSSIGELAWDQQKNIDSSSTAYSNNWETASLRKFLNGKYYDRGDTNSIIYYSNSRGTYVQTLDLTKISLKNDDTRKLIDKHRWVLGGIINNSDDWLNYGYSDFAYKLERENGVCSTCSSYKTSIEDYIGLMYPSDYGYAAEFGENKCNALLNSYNNDICKQNNWLFYNQSLLTITPRHDSNYDIINIEKDGYIIGGESANQEYVRPTLYLNSDVRFKDGVGDGSESSPYQIEID